MKNQQIEIVTGIAFVYNKLKLVITQPVGIMNTTKENLDIKKEATFLSGGPSIAFPCDVLETIYYNLEGIQSYLGKPNRELAIVIDVLDSNTEKEVKDIYDEFEKEYNPLEKYIKENYEIRPLPYIHHNIEKYVPDTNKLEELNILNVNSNDFELEALINRSKQVFNSTIDETIPNILRKSRLVDNVFVANELDINMDTEEVVSYILENNSKVYIPFVYYNHEEESNGLKFANKYEDDIEAEYNAYDIDTGNADLSYGNSIGYLVESNNRNLTIKMANYANYSLSGQTLVTVIEDMGYFKEIMKDDIKEFMIDAEYKANRIKLLNEAKDLILEFEDIISNIGFRLMTDVSINEEALTLIATDPNEEVLELELYDVSRVYRYCIDGCGPCCGMFDEEIDLRIGDIEYDYEYKKKYQDREEFVNYVGHLYYAKLRCHEIYDRLQEIEGE